MLKCLCVKKTETFLEDFPGGSGLMLDLDLASRWQMLSGHLCHTCGSDASLLLV
jgi:hypothetical protein